MHLNDDVVHSKASALFYKAKPNMPSYQTAKKLFGSESTISKEQLIEAIKQQRQSERERERQPKGQTKGGNTDQKKANL